MSKDLPEEKQTSRRQASYFLRISEPLAPDTLEMKRERAAGRLIRYTANNKRVDWGVLLSNIDDYLKIADKVEKQSSYDSCFDCPPHKSVANALHVILNLDEVDHRNPHILDCYSALIQERLPNKETHSLVHNLATEAVSQRDLKDDFQEPARDKREYDDSNDDDDDLEACGGGVPNPDQPTPPPLMAAKHEPR